jgi:hypothetical protein
MQDTLIVILSFFFFNFHRRYVILLSFLISKNTKSSLEEEGFRLTQIMWVVLAVAVLIFLFSS